MDNDLDTAAKALNPHKRGLGHIKRLVVKVGSAVLTDKNGLALDRLNHLVTQLAQLRSQGLEITLVSSGAVAAGRGRLPSKARLKTVRAKQALAAVGQGILMQAYAAAFSGYEMPVAQVLLTRDGLIERERYNNVKNTLQTLLEWDVLPIINENDTVATEELQFTDNDQLSVLVMNLTDAELLVCLSDIDGLYDSDPRENPNARLIHEVQHIDASILQMAGDSPGRAGRGGMKSKLLAARMATSCGIPMIVAGGRIPNVLLRLMSGEVIGTLFHAARRRIHGKKPWIAFTLPRKGRLILDDGAVQAVTQGGKSLLAVGIKALEGRFQAGNCVSCTDLEGREVAIGITNYGAGDLQKVIGCRSEKICSMLKNSRDEVIHRDNLVVLE
jgi:glutamate 5-kinase